MSHVNEHIYTDSLCLLNICHVCLYLLLIFKYLVQNKILFKTLLPLTA